MRKRPVSKRYNHKKAANEAAKRFAAPSAPQARLKPFSALVALGTVLLAVGCGWIFVALVSTRGDLASVLPALVASLPAWLMIVLGLILRRGQRYKCPRCGKKVEKNCKLCQACKTPLR